MKESLIGKKALYVDKCTDAQIVIEIAEVEPISKEHSLGERAIEHPEEQISSITFITSTNGVQYELSDLEMIQSVCIEGTCDNKQYRPEGAVTSCWLFCCEKGHKELVQDFINSYKKG